MSYMEQCKYRDKFNNEINDEDFIILEDEKVCQALRCQDGTLLYEELLWDYNKGRLDLKNEPNYPDSYSNNELEIISYNKAVNLLRNVK